MILLYYIVQVMAQGFQTGKPSSSIAAGWGTNNNGPTLTRDEKMAAGLWGLFGS